jgi:plastocyanin
MRFSMFAAGLVSLALAAGGCSSDDNNGGGTSTGGSSGSTGGSTGSTGGTSGGTGGTTATGGTSGGTGGTSGGTGGSGSVDAGPDPSFKSVEPCTTESAYTTTGTEITVSGLNYMPKCLKVKVGTAVKFSQTFSTHPLEPSTKRGDQTDNPIKKTNTGTEATFTFTKAGQFAYWCMFHGDQDSGKFMAGVVWVVP